MDKTIKAWAIQDRRTKHLRWIAYSREQVDILTASVAVQKYWRVVPVEITIKDAHE